MNDLHDLRASGHSLDDLARDLVSLRAQEDRLRAARVKAEEQLARLVGASEQGVEVRTDLYTINVKRCFRRRADRLGFPSAMETVDPETFARVFPHVPALDVDEYERLREQEPQTFAAVSKAVAIDVMPPTVSIKV